MVDRAQADGADPVTTASIRTVITARPGAPHVLVLTTYDTDADILAAIEAGAVGYLLKDAPPEELVTAVRTAAAGKSALAPAIALRLMDRMRTPDAALSRREIEVLQLVADGHSNLQISQQLFLSQATVKSHPAHTYTKLAVDSRTAAVAAATTPRTHPSLSFKLSGDVPGVTGQEVAVGRGQVHACVQQLIETHKQKDC